MTASIWEDFNSTIASGKYLFHLHTDYTDGSSKIADYFEYASIHKYEALIFTEHVRRNISYRFDNFVEEIKTIGKHYPSIRAFVGAEAKIFPGGDLDISTDILSRIQVICFACHSFPKDVDLYKESFKMLFADKKWDRYIRVWVHPGRFLKRSELLDSRVDTIMDLTRIAVSRNIYIENNIKDGLPPGSVLQNIRPDKIIIGYDAHSVSELTGLNSENSIHNPGL